ncbi:MAG: hypothetical protein EBW15_10720, partial [Actinobacteria bacterium]|nr:hypothetical protein [Actinomycetota bacterium]
MATEAPKVDSPAAKPTPRPGTPLRIAALVVLGGATAALCLLTPSPNTTPLGGVIMDLPERIGNFTGKIIAATPGELAILPKDTEIVRR